VFVIFIVSVRWLITSNSHTVREVQVAMHKRAVFRHCSGDNVESDYLMKFNVTGNSKTFLGLHVKWPIFLSDFNQIWDLTSTAFSQKSPVF
jgi:hypothetical protein